MILNMLYVHRVHICVYIHIYIYIYDIILRRGREGVLGLPRPLALAAARNLPAGSRGPDRPAVVRRQARNATII